MSTSDTCCSISPYFTVQEGKMDEFKALTEQFVERTQTEEGVLYYGFAYHENIAFCREGYVDADATLAHLKNVGKLVEQALTMSSLDRLEICGPESELEKLRGPLSGLNPTYYVLESGFRR